LIGRIVAALEKFVKWKKPRRAIFSGENANLQKWHKTVFFRLILLTRSESLFLTTLEQKSTKHPEATKDSTQQQYRQLYDSLNQPADTIKYGTDNRYWK